MEQQKQNTHVSIIIPVYNEKDTIAEVIERVKEADIGPLKKEIIIIDDGSNDGTKEILRKINNAKVFFHEKNKGKGAAIKTGLQHANGSFILIQDADMEYNPKHYKALLAPLVSGKEQVVYGSRFSKGRFFNKNMYYSHWLGNIALTSITNILYGTRINDMETGYKVMNRDILKDIKLNADGFDIEPELTAKILKKGINIEEVPIDFHPRSFEEGKKINWKHGVSALWVLLKCKWND